MTAETRSNASQEVLAIPSRLLARLREEADRAAPFECCGILLGDGIRVDRVLPAANVADDPTRRFEIDPQVLVEAHRAARAGGPQVVGYYHSHPAGPAEPSATDREMAAQDRSIWAIVAGGDVRFWRDGETRFTELPWEPSAG